MEFVGKSQNSTSEDSLNLDCSNRGNMETLSCVVQTYAWGKYGSKSLAGRLKKLSDSEFDLNEAIPYAELWMGTHPNGPAKLSASGISLSEHLKSCKDAVGKVPDGYMDNDLPFMLKVLSIQTALSIQSHPDKALGKELHKKFPNVYKDPNHKPEMAVALTPFEGMCGFRQISEIKVNIIQFPELKNVLGEEVSRQFIDEAVSDASDEETKKSVLRVLFRKFMECSDEFTNIQIDAMITRLSNAIGEDSPLSEHPINDDHTYVQQLILRLHVDYPADRGVMCPLLLNCIRLEPGEAFFMGPNEPHAYVTGDIVECMALSDNTVRAGLTPKFKDVETLCEMLHYRCGKPSSLLVPIPLDPYTQLYRPPLALCAEFEVERCQFPPGVTVENSPPTVPCGSILLVYQGHLTVSSDGVSLDLAAGAVVYVPANAVVTVTAGDEQAVLFRAHINLTE